MLDKAHEEWQKLFGKQQYSEAVASDCTAVGNKLKCSGHATLHEAQQ